MIGLRDENELFLLVVWSRCAKTRWARTMSRSRSWWTMSQILSQIDTDRVGGYESAIFQRIGGLINYVTPQ